MTETELVERLDRLEATICGGQPVPQTITAHEFDVVDDSGRVRLRIGTVDGGPGIGLSDAQEKTRVGMFVKSSGSPSIELSDANSMKRVEMSVNSSGSPGIKLSDADGFVMDLGRTDTVNLETGAKAQTSAASIVMFGKDKERHVLWQAP